MIMAAGSEIRRVLLREGESKTLFVVDTIILTTMRQIIETFSLHFIKRESNGSFEVDSNSSIR